MSRRISASIPALLGVLAAGLAAGVPAEAQTQRAPPPAAAAQSAQSQMLYQQAAAERDTLRKENTRLKTELDAAKSATRQADAAKGSSAAAQRALVAAQTTIKSQEDALAQSRDRLQELLLKFRDTTGSLAGVESERGQLKQALSTMTVRYDQCAQRNVDLRDLTDQVLTRLEHPGMASVLAREPFTRQSRTRMENLVDEYRARVEDLKVTRAPAEAVGQPGTTPRR